MYKIALLVAIACMSFQIQARMMFQVGAGIDLVGKQTFSNATLGSDSDVKTGASLYGELLSEPKIMVGDLLMGVGMEYQIPRELKDLSPEAHKRQFSYLPIYASVKYVVLPIGISPEGIMQLGYNFLVTQKNFEISQTKNLKAKGGFYWAIGAGVDYRPFVLQLLYKSNQSKLEWDDLSASVQHYESNNVNSQLSLQLGVRL